MLNYVKVQQMVLSDMGKVKKKGLMLGKYKDRMCVIIDGCMIYLVPGRDWVLDTEKILDALHQKDLMDCERFFDHCDNGKTLHDTGFRRIYRGKEHLSFDLPENPDYQVYCRSDIIKYMDKYSTPVFTQEASTGPIWLFGACTVTTLDGLVMPVRIIEE